jgi:hypothetical protein
MLDVAMISAAYYGAKLPLLSLGQVQELMIGCMMPSSRSAICTPAKSGNEAELAKYKVRYLSSAPSSRIIS